MKYNKFIFRVNQPHDLFVIKLSRPKKAVSFYKEGLRVFDLVDPFERHGKDGVAERLTQWVGSFV